MNDLKRSMLRRGKQLLMKKSKKGKRSRGKKGKNEGDIREIGVKGESQR